LDPAIMPRSAPPAAPDSHPHRFSNQHPAASQVTPLSAVVGRVVVATVDLE
jgi:hypothetical protein